MLLRTLLAVMVGSASVCAAMAGESAPPAANEKISLFLDYWSDTGDPGDGMTNIAAPVVAGEAQRGARIEVLEDGKVIAKSKEGPDGWGRWTAQLPKMSEGEHVLHARAEIDGRSYLSSAFNLIVDLTPPRPPTIRVKKGFSDDGTSTYQTLPIEGESGKGIRRVEVQIDKNTTRFTKLRPNGSWTAKVTLEPGTRTLTAIAVDQAGNESKPSKPLRIRIIEPKAPVKLDRLDGKDGTALWVRGFDGSCFGDPELLAASDLDGDGLGDLMIGGSWTASKDESGKPLAQLFGVMGSKDRWKAKVDVPALPARDGFTVVASARNQSEYAAVASAGDINDDGYGDFAILADGFLAVVYGREGGIRQGVDLRDLAPAEGFRILGRSRYSGPSKPVEGIGDFNGDGIGDLVLADQRSLYVVFGKHGTKRGELSLPDMGRDDGIHVDLRNLPTAASVAAGDIDGDGLSDLVVGISAANARGTIYILFGSKTPPGSVRLADYAKVGGAQIRGATLEGERVSVAAGFDLNGDGYDDLVALGNQGKAGRGSANAHGIVLYGGPRKRLRSINLAKTIGPETGFRLIGASDASGWLQSAAAAGDVNGDRIDDLVLGAANGGEDVGGQDVAYVVYGHREGPGDTLDPASLDGGNGFRITYDGQRSIEAPGCAVAGAGDFNGDGIDDIVVSGRSLSRIQQPGAAAYVVFGQRE